MEPDYGDGANAPIALGIITELFFENKKQVAKIDK